MTSNTTAPAAPETHGGRTPLTPLAALRLAERALRSGSADAISGIETLRDQLAAAIHYADTGLRLEVRRG